MGQKVNPNGIRLGIIQDWKSTWYANTKMYSVYLSSDLSLRKFLYKKYDAAAISKIQIERPAKSAKITIFAGKPGVILGKKGGDVELLRKELAQRLKVPVYVNIEEVKKVDLDGCLVADNIAKQLEKRIMFRKAMKKAMQMALKGGAKGVKVCVSGRLGGAEIARSEWYHEGRVPLHTFRADIDYGFAEAHTAYGIIGVKVWIFKGEKIGTKLDKKKEVMSEVLENNKDK